MKNICLLGSLILAQYALPGPPVPASVINSFSRLMNSVFGQRLLVRATQRSLMELQAIPETRRSSTFRELLEDKQEAYFQIQHIEEQLHLRTNDDPETVAQTLIGMINWEKVLEAPHVEPPNSETLMERVLAEGSPTQPDCCPIYDFSETRATEHPFASAENSPTDLHRAVENLDLDRVNALVDSGADASAVDANGATPLHWLAAKGECDRACQPFVDALERGGAGINEVDSEGQTAIYIAAREGGISMVRALLRRNADFNRAGPLGTPLNAATSQLRGSTDRSVDIRLSPIRSHNYSLVTDLLLRAERWGVRQALSARLW